MKYYAKCKSADGAYMDVEGVRYDVSTERRVRSNNGINVGYEQYPSLEASLYTWGVTPVESRPG